MALEKNDEYPCNTRLKLHFYSNLDKKSFKNGQPCGRVKRGLPPGMAGVAAKGGGLQASERG